MFAFFHLVLKPYLVPYQGAADPHGRPCQWNSGRCFSIESGRCSRTLAVVVEVVSGCCETWHDGKVIQSVSLWDWHLGEWCCVGFAFLPLYSISMSILSYFIYSGPCAGWCKCRMYSRSCVRHIACHSGETLCYQVLDGTSDCSGRSDAWRFQWSQCKQV